MQLNEEVLSEDEVDEIMHPNQYVMMVSNANEKKTALARFQSHHTPLKNIIHDKLPDWNISSRNKEQAFAMDLLMDPNIKIVSLIGRAGSGKTLCAVAAGLQQTIGTKENPYSRLIVSRPVQPLGKDIGFLPGTMHEKMLPWLMPIQDNLQYLLGDKNALQMYVDKGKIEIEALTYIRGRSIADAYVVIDEAQNYWEDHFDDVVDEVEEYANCDFKKDRREDDIFIDINNTGGKY